jgi:hypothetical protein
MTETADCRFKEAREMNTTLKRGASICLALLIISVVAGGVFNLTGGQVRAAQDVATSQPDVATSQPKAKTVRDIMWVWGMAQRADPGPKTLATYKEASSKEMARLLDVPNIMLCGAGLPKDQAQALAITKAVSGADRLVWEISTDDGSHKPPFRYTKTVDIIKRVVDEYPKVKAVLLDDMSTGSVSAGLGPKHIRAISDSLSGKYDDVELWGVVYTMSMHKPGMDGIIKALDVVNLWTWQGKKVVDIEKNVAFIEQLVPDKPIILGLYMYNYSPGGRMPMALHKQQCETALKLARAGRIEGIVFLTINNDEQILKWTADWIKRVGDLPLAASNAK